MSGQPTSQANEAERREAQVVQNESADRPGRVPLTARLLLRDSLAVITAAVTATLVEIGRRRFAAQSELDAARQLDRIDQRLARIEATVADRSAGGPRDAS